MPNCPQCGAHIYGEVEEHGLCTTCHAKRTAYPVAQDVQTSHSQAKVEVIEAEIIDEGHEQRQGYAGSGDAYGNVNGFGRVHGRGWQQSGAFGHASRELSCLPGLITLVLGVSLGFQLGFLASLGFFFFYVVGSALAMVVTLRRTLMGKKVFVWLNRALVWICAYAIAFNLAV